MWVGVRGTPMFFNIWRFAANIAAAKPQFAAAKNVVLD
jgi:hypothetical protein